MFCTIMMRFAALGFIKYLLQTCCKLAALLMLWQK